MRSMRRGGSSPCHQYFPRFVKRISALDKAARDYRVWISKAGQARVAQQDMAELATDRLIDAYTPYASAREALLKDLKQFALEELQVGGA